MEFSEIGKYGVEKQFDSYCRKILHRKACNCFSDLLNKRKHEKSLGDLSAAEMGQLVTNDTYPSFYTLFHVLSSKQTFWWPMKSSQMRF